MFHGHFVPLMKRFSIPDVSYFVPLSHSYRNNFREELGMIACSGSWSLYREGPVGGATRPNRFVFLHSPLVGANAIKSIKQPGQGGSEVMMTKASSSPSVCDAVGVAKAVGEHLEAILSHPCHPCSAQSWVRKAGESNMSIIVC